MIPKSIYELLPYLYMIGGAIAVSSNENMIATGSGLIFFVAGAMIWILRSNNRRKDPEMTRKELNGHKGVYELKPFLFILAGVILVNWLNNWIALTAGVLLILTGLYIIIQRSTYRAKRITYTIKKSRN